jgi:threonine/homoserine/homoserine lactone efflux protein
MTEQLTSAFILGLIGGTVPGPVLTAIFTEILQSGVLRSMRIILWAMLTETVIALFSLMALSSLNLSEDVFRGLSLIGAGILIWMSMSIWKIRSIDSDKRASFSPGWIALMILANGVLWSFWITVCVPQAIALGQAAPMGEYLFLGAVEVGWFASTTGIALAFSMFRKVLSNPKVVPVLFKIFALAFVYFAVTMAYGSIVYFMGA